MPIRFDDLSSFDKINLGATLVLAAVVVAFAVAVAGVWLTHRRPAMRALAAYWALFGTAAIVNVFSSWSGAIWRDRVLSLTLTGVLVALHAAAVPLACAAVRRLADGTNARWVARPVILAGLGVLVAHAGGVWVMLNNWPDLRIGPVLWSRSIHAVVYLIPAVYACRLRWQALRNRRSILLLACGLSALAARGVLEVALGLRIGMPDLPDWFEWSAILFNLLGMIALGAASLIAMAAEEEELVRRQGEELRRAEQMLQQGQRLESLGRLAGGVAHDFNNLLTVVVASAENLRDDTPTPTQLEEVDNITGAANRGRALVKQLLTFARQQPAGNDTFDVDSQLASMRGMLERLSGITTLQMSLGGGEAAVQMERSQFDQIVLNLIVNARDASSPGGSIMLSSRLRQEAPMGVLAARRAPASVREPRAQSQWVCLAVEDGGTGISPDVLPFVFEPFFSTKGPEQGTGLGLSTVLGIVARAGGDIVVETAAGKGTRFEVWLPQAVANRPAPSAAVPLTHQPA